MAIPLNLNTIFSVYNSLFPNSFKFITSCIRSLIVYDEPTNGLSTIAVNTNNDIIVIKSFWDEHIETTEELKQVLFHEILHHISGDIFLLTSFHSFSEEEKKKAHYAMNVAMDCRINSYIYNKRIIQSSSSFFKKYYKEDNPDFLIRLLKENSKFKDKEYYKNKKIIDIYYSFYHNSNFSLNNYLDLYNFILEYLMENNSKIDNSIFIGNHSETKEEESGDDKESNNKEISKYFQENNIDYNLDIPKDTLLKETQKAAGVDTLLKELKESSFYTTQKLDLSLLKKQAFNSVFKNFKDTFYKELSRTKSSPIIPTNISKQDLLYLSEGIDVLIWKTKKKTKKKQFTTFPIYLDVSGSVDTYLPELIQLIVNIGKEISSVFVFSTIVDSATIKDLNDRTFKTTGGTHFDCIINHALENNFKSIVVITDGYGYTTHKAKDVKPNIKEVITVLFGCSTKENFFSKNYEKTFDISELKI